jgi:hypothetical protein
MGKLEVNFVYRDGKTLTSDLLTKAVNGKVLTQRRAEFNMLPKIS